MYIKIILNTKIYNRKRRKLMSLFSAFENGFAMNFASQVFVIKGMSNAAITEIETFILGHAGSFATFSIIYFIVETFGKMRTIFFEIACTFSKSGENLKEREGLKVSEWVEAWGSGRDGNRKVKANLRLL